jgi:hypothetical protein
LIALRSVASRLGDHPVQPVLIRLAHLVPKFAASVPSAARRIKPPENTCKATDSRMSQVHGLRQISNRPYKNGQMQFL